MLPILQPHRLASLLARSTPCLASCAASYAALPQWIHEIKDANQVGVWKRNKIPVMRCVQLITTPKEHLLNMEHPGDWRDIQPCCPCRRPASQSSRPTCKCHQPGPTQPPADPSPFHPNLQLGTVSVASDLIVRHWNIGSRRSTKRRGLPYACWWRRSRVHGWCCPGVQLVRM